MTYVTLCNCKDIHIHLRNKNTYTHIYKTTLKTEWHIKTYFFLQCLSPASQRSRQGDAFYWTAKTSNSQAITPCLNGSCLTINHWDKVPQGSHLFSYKNRQGPAYACACICKWERQAKTANPRITETACVVLYMCATSSAGGFIGCAI